MTHIASLIRTKMDRAGIILSGLCAAHCLASILLLSALGIGGVSGLAGADGAHGMAEGGASGLGWLLAPEIHRIGLAVALFIAAVAIGWGSMLHRRRAPFVIAMMGLTFMGGALAGPHGMQEAVLTIIGVALVSAAHVLNLRRT